MQSEVIFMEEEQLNDYQIIFVRLPKKVVDTLNRIALQRRNFLRSEVVNDFFKWGFDEFLKERRD